MGPAAAVVRLFEADPDLLDRVPAEEREVARRRAIVSLLRVPAGRWDAALPTPAPWGVLVVDGIAARELDVAATSSAELIGAGDVVLLDTPAGETTMLQRRVRWTVLEPMRLALLDRHVTALVRRWPDLTAGLMERVQQRADRLAATQAVANLTRVDARVLVTLWLLADRWGRVTGEGIVLPLPLTHRTLARLIGARRPSVTTAITELTRAGRLERRDDGSWMLRGAPPPDVEAAVRQTILATAPGRPRPRPAPAVHRRAGTPTVAVVPPPGRGAQQLVGMRDAHAATLRRAAEVAARSRAVFERSRAIRARIAAQRAAGA